MAAYWLIYHNETFRLTKPPKKLIRYRIKALPDGSKLYIDKHHRTFDPDTIHLITYTHSPLTRSQITVLTRRAYKFVRNLALP